MPRDVTIEARAAGPVHPRLPRADQQAPEGCLRPRILQEAQLRTGPAYAGKLTERGQLVLLRERGAEQEGRHHGIE